MDVQVWTADPTEVEPGFPASVTLFLDLRDPHTAVGVLMVA